jgi:hypothetical protein
MPPDEPTGPDLDGVVADANAVGLDYVVIGGFSVIYHGYVRATRDSDLLVPDGPEADAAVLRFLQRVDGRRLRDNEILTPEDVAEASSLRVTAATASSLCSHLARALPVDQVEYVLGTGDRVGPVAQQRKGALGRIR